MPDCRNLRWGCSSVWSPGPVANQLSASLADLVCTNNNNNKASVQVLAKHVWLSLQGYVACGKKPQVCSLPATYSTLLLLFSDCRWGASQSQISKGMKMFYGSPPQPCWQNVLLKQNDFLTDMAPIMKQNRLEGEYLPPQVISVLEDARAASLALSPQLTFWLHGTLRKYLLLY